MYLPRTMEKTVRATVEHLPALLLIPTGKDRPENWRQSGGHLGRNGHGAHENRLGDSGGLVVTAGQL